MGSYISDYYGLIFNCPMGSERDGCAFGNVRQLSIKERLAYFDVLTEPEKMNLITKHQQCLKVREKSTLFHESQ